MTGRTNSSFAANDNPGGAQMPPAQIAAASIDEVRHATGGLVALLARAAARRFAAQAEPANTNARPL